MLSGLCADGLIGGLVWQASPSRDRLAMVFCFVVVFFGGGGGGAVADSEGFPRFPLKPPLNQCS